MMTNKDPTECFQVTGFDEDTKTLQISIHPLILSRKSQEVPLTVKAIQIMGYEDGIDSVDFVPRETPKEK